MREIKFRAWVKSQKRMVSVGGLCFNHPVQIEVPKIGKEKMAKSAWSDSSNFEFWNQGAEAILMQYTGLHDKNGNKEIYEGDIVRINLSKPCIVKFGPYRYSNNIDYSTEGIGFFIEREEEDFCDGMGKFRYFVKTPLSPPIRSDEKTSPYEILGNVYENPEFRIHKNKTLSRENSPTK